MKKTEKRTIWSCVKRLPFLCLFLFSGCGLTEYYYLNAPTVTYNVPSYTSSDYTTQYFSFLTADNGSVADSGYSVLGTAVYYKIYNNYSTMSSYISAISSLNTKSNGSAAATRMIETYGYKQLGTSSGTVVPLISGAGRKKVFIRLSNRGNASSHVSGSETDYRAKVIIAGSELYVPRRTGNSSSFDFGRTSENTTLNPVPVNGDEDVLYGSASEANKWYIDLYAVSVGQDSSYTTSYSLVLHLGNVMINSSAVDN